MLSRLAQPKRSDGGSTTPSLEPWLAGSFIAITFMSLPVVAIIGAPNAGKTALMTANQLSPAAIDPNAYTPEFKGFLVKIEKA